MNLTISVFFIVISLVLTQLFYVLAQNTRLMDKPNDRSLHVHPTVRGGGLVFIGLGLLSVPWLCVLTSASLRDPFILMVSVFLLAGISFLDDLYQLSARSRFIVQCVVAILIAFFIRPEDLNFILFSFSNAYVVAVFLFFVVIWAINHFNFMDGLDGFCASQALFLLGAYFYFFSAYPALMYQDFCLVLISCIIGFLAFNFPPAKLFMGDVGSASLGLITFVIAVIGQQKYQIPIVYWFLLNAIFLFDATLTLLRRIFNKERWFAPHRKHAYQRLKQFGVSSRLILLGQLMTNLSFFMLVVLLDGERLTIGWVVMIQLTFMLGIYSLIEKCFPMFETSKLGRSL